MPPCRNLLLFRHGSRPGPHMSLFLNAAEGDTSAPGWMRTATFKLWIINQRDPSRSVQKGVHPQFSKSSDTSRVTQRGVML